MLPINKISLKINNMGKRYKCPFCLHEFTKNEAIAVEKNGLTLYKCPNNATDPLNNRLLCGKYLPLRFFNSDSVVVSLVGGPGVGKTYFFMALKRILENGAINELGITGNMFYGDDESKAYFDNIQKNFNNGTRIDATQKDAGVERHSLGLEIHVEKILRNRTIYFSFFDNPGEGFNDPNYIANNMNLHRSDAVIFLISPEQLEGLIPVTAGREGTIDNASPISDILNNIINISTMKGKERYSFFKSKINIPFAFCISKYDCWGDAYHISLPDDFNHAEFHNKIVNNIPNTNTNDLLQGLANIVNKPYMMTIDNLSSSIENNLYNRYNNTNLKIRIKENFSTYKYFSVQSIKFDEDRIIVSPKGISLPIIWVLNRLRFL